MCKVHRRIEAYLLQKNDTCRVDPFLKKARSNPRSGSEYQESHRLLAQVATLVMTLRLCHQENRPQYTRTTRVLRLLGQIGLWLLATSLVHWWPRILTGVWCDTELCSSRKIRAVGLADHHQRPSSQLICACAVQQDLLNNTKISWLQSTKNYNKLCQLTSWRYLYSVITLATK